MTITSKATKHPTRNKQITVQCGTIDELYNFYKVYPMVKVELLKQQLEDIVRINDGFGALYKYALDDKGKTWMLPVYIKIFTNEFIGEGI